MGSGRTGIVVIACVAIVIGCVERTVQVNTQPPGALVWMNDQEIGRTPLKRDFIYYGTYDVQVRADGYETLNTRTEVIAPWWQWPVLDLFAELWPGRLRDERTISYTLHPKSNEPVEASEMLARATELRGQLESSKHTRTPTTVPTTRAMQSE
jgi:hypothetical protein